MKIKVTSLESVSHLPSVHVYSLFMKSWYIYSRTSMARTLMARLPRLVRTRSWVPWKKIHSCRFGII